MLTQSHQKIIIACLEQVPPNFRVRYTDNVVDALFGRAEITDDYVRKVCREVGERMELRIIVTGAQISDEP